AAHALDEALRFRSGGGRAPFLAGSSGGQPAGAGQVLCLRGRRCLALQLLARQCAADRDVPAARRWGADSAAAARSSEQASLKVLWLARAIPYPPKAGFLSRSYHLLRELARRQDVDLISFVQEPWVTTLFPTLQDGLEQSRLALGEFCRSVTFLPIDRVRH